MIVETAVGEGALGEGALGSRAEKMRVVNWYNMVVCGDTVQVIFPTGVLK